MVAKAKEGFSSAGDVVGGDVKSFYENSKPFLGEGERLSISSCQALPPSQSPPGDSFCDFNVILRQTTMRLNSFVPGTKYGSTAIQETG